MSSTIRCIYLVACVYTLLIHNNTTASFGAKQETAEKEYEKLNYHIEICTLSESFKQQINNIIIKSITAYHQTKHQSSHQSSSPHPWSSSSDE